MFSAEEAAGRSYTMPRGKLTTSYMLCIVAAGSASLIAAAALLPFGRADVQLAVLCLLTLVLGPRITVPIPQLRSRIAVSDTFVVLTLLIYGGEFAMLLAAAEAMLASWSFCKRRLTVFFNSASAAMSVGASAVVLHVLGIASEPQLRGRPGHFGDFITALFTLALVQFAVNTTLAAGYDALSERVSIWSVWKAKYLWAFLTYLVGTLVAGVLLQAIDGVGFVAIAAAIPVMLLLYFTYRMYLTTVRLSLEQAHQASEYAKLLEERSAALRDSEQRFRAAFEHAPIGIALVNDRGEWMKVNHSLCYMLDRTEDELIGWSFRELVHPDDRKWAFEAIDAVLRGRQQSCEVDFRFQLRDSRIVWASVNLSSTSVADGHDEYENFVFQLQDITESKLAEQRLQHEASHDSLTGLPNRAHFMRRLDEALDKRKANPKYMVSVLFIDLDRFKYVNDSLGHFIGDELLIAIAKRLNESMRPPDMVARLGGDEFVVLVEGRYYAEKMTRIAERIQQKISSPFQLRGHEVFTTASIGILNVSEEHRASEDVIRDADTAMYQAKRSGKARHEMFDETMRDAVRATLQLETDLRKAIQNDEFELCYQPIVSLEDGTVHSLEALARWNHSTLGVISPDRFIPLAEETGLIDPLGEQLLARACREVQQTRERLGGDPAFKLSVNLSSCQFTRHDLVEMIASKLEETGFPANRLKLEITETVFFEHHDRAIEMLNRLRSLGITTDVDDFGTGYSNFGYLVRIPISTLKIDRSFVMMMDENPANREVIRTVIGLARNLGLSVIAEGIETEQHRDELRSLGCDYGQGYYFARPMGADQVEKFLIEKGESGFRRIPPADVPEITTVQ